MEGADVIFAAYNQTVVVAQTCTGGDEVTADHVLLHALESVGLAVDSSFVEHLGGLLERSGRHEARCLQSSAGDTLKDLLGGSGHGVAHGYELEVFTLERRVLVAEFAGSDDLTGLHVLAVAGVEHHFLAPDAVVLFHEGEFIDHLLLKEAGVTGINYIDLAHHLAHDHFEVLVVDLHTLHAVHVLNLVDDVFLNGRRTHDIEDIGGSDGTVGQGSTGTHVVVFLNENLLRQRNEILADLAGARGDGDLAVTAFHLTEVDLAVDLGHDSGV